MKRLTGRIMLALLAVMMAVAVSAEEGSSGDDINCTGEALVTFQFFLKAKVKLTEDQMELLRDHNCTVPTLPKPVSTTNGTTTTTTLSPPTTTTTTPGVKQDPEAPTNAPEAASTAAPGSSSEIPAITTPSTPGNVTSPTSSPEAGNSTTTTTVAATPTGEGVYVWSWAGPLIGILLLVSMVVGGFYLHRYTKRVGYRHSAKTSGDAGTCGNGSA